MTIFVGKSTNVMGDSGHTHMVHSEEFRKRNDDAGIPGEDGESDEYKIQEKSWKDEYRDFGIPLHTSVGFVHVIINVDSHH